jgi:hypothetical protein
MNPLIRKYFDGELTDPEEMELEKLLEGSEEAAWEFGQAAEEAYRRYGLPDPAPQDPTDGPTKGSGPWGWIVPLLGILLLGGFVGWKMTRPMPQLPANAPARPIQEPAAKPKPKPAVKVEEKRPVTAAPKPFASPPEGMKERVSGTDLRVVVKRETAGPVTVAVVNSYGQEIRRLYSGLLNAGDWSFEWDGRAGSGVQVQPGTYRIQVMSEAGLQSRELTIR